MSAYAYQKVKGGTWYIGYRGPSGKQMQQATQARTKTEAQKLADELAARAERLRLGLDAPPRAAMRFETFCDQYISRVAKLKRGYRPVVSRINNHLRPFFGQMDLARIDVSEVQRFLGDRMRRVEQGTLALYTLEQLRGLLQKMLGTAIKWDLMAGPNPAAAVDRLKVPQKDPRYLELHEVTALIQATPAEWRNLVRTLVCCNLRRGEVIGVKREDVSMERRTIRVRRSYDADVTKSGKPRTVAIPDELAPFLEEQLAAHQSDWVFPGDDGKMMNKWLDLGDLIATWAAAAGIAKRVTTKDLRSTWATHAAEQMDIRLVQAALGHSDLATTTQRYAHLRGGRLVQEGRGLRLLTSDSALTGAPAQASGDKEKAQ